MTSVLEYTLYGEPLPMPRPRIGKGHAYEPPAPVRELKARHVEAVQLAKPEGWPMGARFSVDIVAYRGTARKCDVDNLGKLVLDALNRHAFDDDSQVDRLAIRKRIDREDPRTEVRVAYLGEAIADVRAALKSRC